MKKTMLIIPAVGLMLIGGLSFAAFQSASADENQDNSGMNLQREGQRQGPKNEAVKEALENKDYEAFLEATNNEKRKQITEEQFNAMIKAHELREEGNFEEARKVIEESGLEFGGRKGKRGSGNGPDREKMREILNDLDYEAFKIEFEGRGVLEDIDSEEKFNQFVKMHELMEEEKFEEARAIADELGLKRRSRMDRGECQRYKEDQAVDNINEN